MAKIINAVIIDDEKRSVSILSKLIAKSCSDIRILGTANSVEEGIQCIDKMKPDLVFLDIYMPDGDGFEVLECVKFKSFKVIFTTAHDKYALRAIEFAAIDYLLKPIGIKKLESAVARFRDAVIDKEFESKVGILKDSLNNQFRKIAFPSMEGMVIVKLEEIIRCEASDNYSVVHIKDDKPIIVTKPLNSIEIIFEDLNFFRVHNKHLINLYYLKKFEKGKGGYVVLEDNTSINVSIRRKHDLINKIKEYAKSVE